MNQSVTIINQRGCGCVSGCMTTIALGVLVFFGPPWAISWLSDHFSIVFVAMLAGAVALAVTRKGS